MSAKQPTFQQRYHTVNEGQKIISDNGILANYYTSKACRGQKIIAVPTIGSDNSTGFNSGFDSLCQAFSGCINYPVKTNTANMIVFIFHSYKDKCFTSCTMSSLPRLFPAYISFVDLDHTRKAIPTWTNHCTSQFMQPSPGSPIAAQPQHSFKSQGTNTMLLTRNVPNCSEPQPQRLSSILKDSTRNYRNPIAAFLALIKLIILCPSFVIITARTTKPIWPPKVVKVLTASFFCRKTVVKFHNRFRVIFHTRILHLVGRAVKCIAP